MLMKSPALYFLVDKYMLTCFWTCYGYALSLLIRWTENQPGIKRYQRIWYSKSVDTIYSNQLNSEGYIRHMYTVFQEQENNYVSKLNYPKSMRTKFDRLRICSFCYQVGSSLPNLIQTRKGTNCRSGLSFRFHNDKCVLIDKIMTICNYCLSKWYTRISDTIYSSNNFWINLLHTKIKCIL